MAPSHDGAVVFVVEYNRSPFAILIIASSVVMGLNTLS
jgi:hypothetical protein